MCCESRYVGCNSQNAEESKLFGFGMICKKTKSHWIDDFLSFFCNKDADYSILSYIP